MVIYHARKTSRELDFTNSYRNYVKYEIYSYCSIICIAVGKA